MAKKLSYRFATVPPTSVKQAPAGNRTLRVCFSSESPLLVRDKDGTEYYEVLSHAPGDADLTMLQDGGAFLDEHNHATQVGSILRAEICSDRKGRAELAFADTPLGNERWELMRTRTRKDISFGYIKTRLLHVAFHEDGKQIRRYAWKAFEISSVAVGADHFQTGVGRGNNFETNDKKNMNDTTKRTEMIAIQKFMVHDHPHLEAEIRKIQTRGILEDMSLPEFKKLMMELVQKQPAPPKPTMPADHEIGMDRNEIRQYSFARAMRNAFENGGRLKNCFEADVSEQVERTSGTRAEGWFVPSDVLLGGSRRAYQQRDLTVGDSPSAGFMVNTDMPLPVIELLRNKMVCLRLGARYLGGLQGPVLLPRQVAPATAQAVPEIGELQDSGLQLDQLHLTPHRIGATTTYGKQLVFQSTPDAEAVIRDDLMQVVAIKHDYMLLAGQGAADEPLGLLNTPGINAVTFGGAPTFGKIVAFETLLGKMNADSGRLAYATSPGAKGIWKETAVALSGATTVSSRSLWENAAWGDGDGSNDGLVNGYRAASTNQIPGDAAIFGNWQELFYATWSGWDMIMDIYTKAKMAEIVLTINTWMDGGLRHAQSFTVSTDSAAQ